MAASVSLRVFCVVFHIMHVLPAATSLLIAHQPCATPPPANMQVMVPTAQEVAMMRSRTASVGGGALSGAGSRGSSMPPLDDLFAAAVAAASMTSPLSGRTTGGGANGAAGAWPPGQQQSNGMYSSSVHSLTPRTSVSGGVTPGWSGMTVSTGVGTQANGGVAGVGRLSSTQLPPRPTPSPPASERQPLSPSPSPSVAKAGRTEIETQTGLQVTCEKSFYRRRLMAPAIPFSSSEGECAGLIKCYAFKAEGYVSHIHLDDAMLETLCRDVYGITC